jgi:uncharacterized protein (DUF1697 family)
MKLVIKIHDNKVKDVENSFASTFGYKEKISTGEVDELTGEQIVKDNPMSKKEFVKERIISFIKDVVKSQSVEIAIKEARDRKIREIDSEVIAE